MWTLLLLFLTGGLFIIVITMIAFWRWMWKRWSWHRTTTEDIVEYENQRQEVFELWLDKQVEEIELTRQLDETEWYPYTHDAEGNVIVKNP